MSTEAKRRLAAFIAGLVFSLGLVIGGMTEPANVVGFLDVTHDWHPALMFVMAGAIGVHALVYRWTRGRRAPLFAEGFSVPTRRDLDARLIVGAAVFGIGWGLGGFCPGPGITSLASGSLEAMVFVGTMLGGMKLVGFVERAREERARVSAGAAS